MNTIFSNAAITLFFAMMTAVPGESSSNTLRGGSILDGGAAIDGDLINTSIPHPIQVPNGKELVLATNGDSKGTQRKLAYTEEEDWSSVYNFVSAFGGNIPIVGSLIQFGFYEYWTTDSSSDIFSLIEDRVQDMIDESLFDYTVSLIESDLIAIQDSMDAYDASSSYSLKGNWLTAIINNCNYMKVDLHMSVEDYNLETDSDQLDENFFLIEYAIAFAPIHLAALRDQYVYGAYLYYDSEEEGWDTDTDKLADLQLWYDELEEQAQEYQTYFDFMLSEYETWRYGKFNIDSECDDWGTFQKQTITILTDSFDEYDSSVWYCETSVFGQCKNSNNSCENKAEDQIDEYLPTLYTEFEAVLDPVSDLYNTVMDNIPTDTSELCQYGQGIMYSFDAGARECTDVPDCLLDDDDGDCEENEMCFTDEDCVGDLICWGDYYICLDADNLDSSITSKRRRMESLGDYVVQEFQWEDVKNHCSDFEYQLNLAVDNHMYIQIVPSQEAIDAGCTVTLLLHRGWSDKAILEQTTDMDVSFGTLPVGAYPLSKIAGAYDAIVMNGMSHGYDVIMNSCGDFIIRFAQEMGLKATPEQLKWVANQLAHHSADELAPSIMINHNRHLVGLDVENHHAANGSSVRELSQADIIERVVSFRAQVLY